MGNTGAEEFDSSPAITSDRPTAHNFLSQPRCLENWYVEMRKLSRQHQFYIETAERTIAISLYIATHQFLYASGPLKRLFFRSTMCAVTVCGWCSCANISSACQ